MNDDLGPYVFICYTHNDAHFAASFSDRLRKAGITHFRDTEAIKWGQSIPDRVHAALEDATHVVVIVSPGSELSQWVAYEMGYARGNGAIVVPYLLYPDLDVPLFLSDARCLHGRDDEDDFVGDLVQMAKDVADALSPDNVITDSSEDAAVTREDAIEMVKSPHPRVRSDGVDVLVDLKAEKDLLAFIGYRERYVRSSVALGLARLHSKKALKYLVDGLGRIGGPRSQPVIPDVEKCFVHYRGDASALDALLKGMRKEPDYADTARWVTAIANVVDAKTAPTLLKQAEERDSYILLKAAFESGVDLRKKDLEPAIRVYCSEPEDRASSRATVATWLLDSKRMRKPWVTKLVAGWVKSYFREYASRDNYPWGISDLTTAALDMGALTCGEVTKAAQAMTNETLARKLEEVTKSWKQENSRERA